jgi:hypothetical protein
MSGTELCFNDRPLDSYGPERWWTVSVVLCNFSRWNFSALWSSLLCQHATGMTWRVPNTTTLLSLMKFYCSWNFCEIFVKWNCGRTINHLYFNAVPRQEADAVLLNGCLLVFNIEPRNLLRFLASGDNGKKKRISLFSFRRQGCQMVYFHTKNPNLGFCRAGPWNGKVRYILR